MALLLFLFDHCCVLTRMISWYWNRCQNGHTSCYTSKHLRRKDGKKTNNSKPLFGACICTAYINVCVWVSMWVCVCIWHSLKRLPAATGILSLTWDEWRKHSKQGCCSGLFTFSGIRFLHAVPPPHSGHLTYNMGSAAADNEPVYD